MSPTTPVPPSAPPPRVDPAALWALVEAVDTAVASQPPGSRPDGAMLLRLTGAPGDPHDAGGPTADAGGPTAGAGGLPAGDALDLGVQPLDGDHPLEALLGFVAPPDWLALGVTSPGLGHPTPGDPAGGDAAGGNPAGGDAAGGNPAGGGRPTTERVHVTVLLSRCGGAAGVIRRGPHATRLGEPPGGVVADACRRALALPTAPPPPTTAGLWALSWLDRLVEAATTTGPPRPITWPEAAGFHPAAPAADPPTPATLAQATGRLAAERPWPRLRADPAGAGTPGPQPTPAQAAWMDDGMFARWLLAWFPPLDDLLDACHDLLPEPVAGRIEHTVALTLADPQDLP